MASKVKENFPGVNSVETWVFGIIPSVASLVSAAADGNARKTPMILVGQTIGEFEIQKELGSGAMGSVYLARYKKTNRPVAMKVIATGLGDNERVQQRFEREAQILKQLKHPNIVRLLASGRYHRSPFYVMEFIDGEPLDAVLTRRGRFSWEEVVEHGKQICAALEHAHANGIIHRDLKPSNLMLAKNGVLKLTDFGIAKDTDVTGLTSANSTVGTAAYMSPEQCRGERDLTHKSDLYSLGILLYELLTGQKPFHAENAMDMFIQHVQGSFDRPAELVPDIPVWLDTLVCQLMEKKPEHRPMDAATVAAALDEVVQRVETRRSAGEDSSARSSKKARPRAERATGEGSFVRKTKKKRTDSAAKDGGRLKLILTASGLLLLLALVVTVLVFALQPASPATLLAEGEKLLAQGDQLFDNSSDTSDDRCWFKWDAAASSLSKLAGRYPDSPEAETARKRLEYIEDGKAYLTIRKTLGEKTWTQSREKSDKLLGKLSGGKKAATLPGGKFISRLQAELVKFEAPKLFEDGKKHYDRIFSGSGAYDAAGSQDWIRAKSNLGDLVDRYLDTGDPVARDGKVLLERVLVFEAAFLKLRGNIRSSDPVEAQMIETMRAEREITDPKEALAKWRAFRESGFSSEAGARRPADDPKYRVYFEIADEKLRRLSST